MNKLGPYLLIERIASGGMGEIYLASLRREAGFEKAAAVKRILPHLAHDESFVKMFEAEARLTALLKHPNIVDVYDFGKSGGEAWIAMELVDGFDLRTLVDLAKKADRPLSAALSIRIVAECARGLDYAHRRKDSTGDPLRIIHRDVSPQNVLISMEGEVKLTDFGLAKALSIDTASASGMLKGKLAYMPPEQLRGQPLDARADVFSLGAVLYELLAGERMYPADLPVPDLVARVDAARFEPLSEVAPTVPYSLTRVVARALSPAPDDRYQSAADFEKALRDAATTEGLTAEAADLAAYMSTFAAERRVVAELAEDGTVVSKKPIVERDIEDIQLDPTLVADSRSGGAGAETAEVSDAVVIDDVPNRWLGWALAGVALVLLGVGVWTVSRVPFPRIEAPRVPIVVTPRVLPGPRPLRVAANGVRSGRRALADPPAARLVLADVPAGASCFLHDELRDRQRDFACGATFEVPAGPHRLVVVMPGRASFTKHLHLVAGDNRVTIPPAEVDPEPVTCDVEIVTTPAGAEVTIDGRTLAERTPTRLIDLTEGTHRLQLSRRGRTPTDTTFDCHADTPATLEYALADRLIEIKIGRKRRKVRPGASFGHTATVGPVTARLRVEATLTGARFRVDATPFADVSVGGRAYGHTPLTFRLGVGAHTIKLARDGKIGRLPVRITLPRN